MISERGREVHADAVEAVEKQQDLLGGLNLINEALTSYQKDNDYSGMSEVEGYRSLVYRLFYSQTNDEAYLILAKEAATSAVELAKLAKDESVLALPYRDLGQVFVEMNQYSEAVQPLRESLKIFMQNPPEMHDNRAVKAEVKGRLGYALYRSGKKDEGGKLLSEAIGTLEKEEKSYEMEVWLSGVHMRFAEALREDNIEEAKMHLQKAREIIDENSELKLRKAQWEKLASRFG